MICFNCGIKLYGSELNECQLCGVKFDKVCTSCNSLNPLMGKYCFNCGAKLAQVEPQSTIQNFDTLSENRKNVAVIFADVSGFTALSEKLDPEEVRELINDCFDYITKPVYELEGTIDKYIGDCVMILFGAKYIHSDDAKRAVICAMRMMSLIREFSVERLSSKGLSLDLSIGINYGLVVTGSIGNTFDRDYTVMGDIVNTAQRLQSNADRGTVLVSESVFSETKGIIKYSEPMEIKVKNKEKAVRCYSPIEISAEYDYDSKKVFIGREKELGLLVSIYNDSLNTSTKCINIIGEAGVGKTSLLQEFLSKLDQDIKKVWVDLNSFSQNKVYYTVSSILMKIMNINSAESSSVRQRRLVSFLDYIMADLSEEEIERNCNFIGLVLGLKRNNEFQNILNSMSFENIRKEIIKQLSLFFIKLSQKFRMVIVVDDMHWSDTNSLQILRELIKSLSLINITFIFSSRYELEEIGPLSYINYHTLKLQPLTENAIGTLACKLLDCEEIDESLFKEIMKFTNGNPLYIYEFIQSIKRSESFVVKKGIGSIDSNKAISLPNNIQSLILSNISEMNEAERNFLQAASVMGNKFSLSLLGPLLEMDSDEVNDLIRLPVRLNIISLKEAYTALGAVEKIFVFNQDVEREVIYDSILNKDKRELHQRIGELIEAKYCGELEGYYEILFTHFRKSGQNKKAAEYSYKTAIKDRENYNFPSSLQYYNHFLQLVLQEGSTKMDSRVLDAYRDMAYINFIMADYNRSLSNLDKALEIATLYDDIYSIKLMIADIYKETDMYDDALKILEDLQPKIKEENTLYGKLLQMKCSILRILGDTDALAIAQKSEQLLIKMKDFENLSETMNQAGIIYYTKGDVTNSLLCLDKSYKYAEKINNLAIMSKVSGNLGAIYHATGMISKAQEFFDRSIQISKKISDQQGYIAGCTNLGILYLNKGLFDKAEILFNEAVEMSREISSRLNECIAVANIGEIMFKRGLDYKALEYYNRSFEIARELKVPIGEGIYHLSTARMYIENKMDGNVRKMLDAAFKIFTEAEEVLYLSDCYRNKALHEFMQGKIEAAIEDCKKAAQIAQEIKSDIRRLKALRLNARILAYMEQNESAFKLIDESIILSHQLESDYEAAKGYIERLKLHRKLGNWDKAREDLKRARECAGKFDRCKLKEIIEGYEL
ncbi:adenylate/guanylate cyclase domain-containing protein [Acetivibrio mesophilus]|uniref:Guanylate cyclase n=1 Tax=Acetivibrio mesophilus TaxID=2487273 RepID=A0A4Q0I2Y3_9FIRM|nr:adenylate/guanylate cyclase domain-containing protein [Acetivibrio mesophilus]RXE58576.1 guanylate cyclase [Acetivibrio mesophilus]